MSAWQGVIEDSQAAIALMPHNLKGYYYLAQAEIAISDSASALLHAKEAHRICVAAGQKEAGSLTNITELVLKCKKVDWERREKIRIREKGSLINEMEDLLRAEGERISRETELEGEGRRELEQEYERKIELLRTTFEVARMNEEEELKRRVVPDWAIDGISFAIMVDPVVVSYVAFSMGKHANYMHADCYWSIL
jgi:STIP1 family protein 1